MFRRKSLYPASEAEAKERMRSGIRWLAYLVIALLVGITGLHAVMIILSETADFTFFGWTGLALTILTAARLGFPLLAELAALIHTIGAIHGVWKGGQKSWGTAIDGIWLLFAALNMVTFFAIERGAALEGWQVQWLQWGLPLSGVIAGWMVIRMILADPAHKRAEEQAATEEQRISNEEAAKSDVQNSDAMYSVQVHRAWRDYANGLYAQGYNEDEVEFIMSHVPELRAIAKSRGQAQPPAAGLIEQIKSALGKNAQNTPPQEPATKPASGQGDRVLTTFATSEEEVLKALAELAQHRAANGQEPPTPRPQ